jgi:transposase-like protein
MTRPAKATGQQPRPGTSGGAPRKKRTKLAPSQKYEVFTSVLTNAATQREIAEKYKIDRSTIRSICQTAKGGALGALAAAVPGRRGKTADQEALEAANERIAALEATVCEQAMRLHITEGKEGWG